ncbi:hypothetical protein BMS3Abin04_00395 [bacterium BMS3Abin04]|nr:hypothetical protein BMS3Abin04_00395 [bacterium BMS3Abin04]
MLSFLESVKRYLFPLNLLMATNEGNVRLVSISSNLFFSVLSDTNLFNPWSNIINSVESFAISDIGF